MIYRPARGFFPRLLLLALLVVSPLAGCGAGGADAGGDEVKIEGDQFRLSGTQRDAQFAVGSEDFTEQEVLGNIAIQALEAADATVIDRTGLGGKEAVRQALEDGEIDLYWEYTATGWLVHLRDLAYTLSPEAVRGRSPSRPRGEWHQVARPRPGERHLCYRRERENGAGTRRRDRLGPEAPNRTLRRLNYAVDIQNKAPEKVARTWLQENGFIE